MRARSLPRWIGLKLPEAGDPLPAIYQFVYFLETPRGSDTRGDGHPKSALNGLLPAALPPRRMIANDALTFEHPLILGQRAERTTTVKAVDHKTGKSGELVFVTIEHVFSQGGRVCLREEQAFAYRQFPPATLAPSAGRAAEARRALEEDVDSRPGPPLSIFGAHAEWPPDSLRSHLRRGKRVLHRARRARSVARHFDVLADRRTCAVAAREDVLVPRESALVRLAPAHRMRGARGQWRESLVAGSGWVCLRLRAR